MRYYQDWIKGYLDYVSHKEAPRIMQYWAGVSAIGAALERKVYFDMGDFRWFPNFYIVFVGPPEIVKKSNTASDAARLLRQLPDFQFGSNITTWQAMVNDMRVKSKMIEVEGQEEIEEHSCIYVNAGEFGNFLNPQDKEMVNLLIALWDGETIDKSTKTAGKDYLEFPLLNLTSCTTPSWLLDNIPRTMIDGGLFSRILFVGPDSEDRDVAYPKRTMSRDHESKKEKLISDLNRIYLYQGEVTISDEAMDFGEKWYKELRKKQREGGSGSSMFQRKQAQVHKLGMVLAAAKDVRDSLGQFCITLDVLKEAISKIDELEVHRAKIFGTIGQSRDSQKAEGILEIVKHFGKVTLADTYSKCYNDFPKFQDFRTAIVGLIKSGQIKHQIESKETTWLIYVED